jgi:hypothetical protein
MATMGTWIFVSGTVAGDTIDELGNFTLTVATDRVTGGSICGVFVSQRTDGELYPLEPVWQPDATGDASLCQPGPRAIISNFGQLSPVQLSDTTLVLADATTQLTFDRFATPEPVATNWVLSSARDAKGKLALSASAKQLDLRVDVKHHYVLFDGCHAGSGQWAGGIGDFTLTAGSAAVADCSDKKVLKLQKRYVAALAQVTTAEIVDGVLELTGPKKVRLRFAAATAD